MFLEVENTSVSDFLDSHSYLLLLVIKAIVKLFTGNWPFSTTGSTRQGQHGGCSINT